MKLSELLAELQRLKDIHGGEIEVELMNDPSDKSGEIIGYEHFFIVAEPYEDGPRVNLRTWPY